MFLETELKHATYMATYKIINTYSD